MTHLSIGIAGCGIAGRGHLGSYLQAGGQKAFLWDIRPEAARTLAEETGATVLPDFESLIHHPGIDAVIIATPNRFHASQAIAALDAGKHVLLEKPMALNQADAEAVIAAAERNRRLLHIGFELRSSHFPLLAKELIANGELGPLISANVVHYRGHFWPEWKGKSDNGGSLFLMEDCHAIDLFRWWSGDEVEQVHAIGTRRNVVRHYDYPDTHFATFAFRNGFVAHISDCHARSAIPDQKEDIFLPEYGHQYEYSLVGENGSLHFLPIRQLCHIYRHEAQPNGAVYQKLSRTVHFETFAKAIHNGEEQMLGFLKALAGDAPPLSDPLDAFQTHLVCYAAEEALSCGRPVAPTSTLEAPTRS